MQSLGNPTGIKKEEEYFVKNPSPRPVFFDAASLVVDPESVPSKTYLETFSMLEMRLNKFPSAELRDSLQHEVRDVRHN